MAAMGPLPRNWVPQQPHPASHWVPSAVVGASTTASWGKGEEPQPETLGTPRAQRLTWDPLKSRVRLVGLDTSPMEMCPTSEPASRRMGFPHRSPATPGGQRAPGAGGACTQPQETGCPQARPCAGRALQALPAARAALREGPVGAAHPPGLYLQQPPAALRPGRKTRVSVWRAELSYSMIPLPPHPCRLARWFAGRLKLILAPHARACPR